MPYNGKTDWKLNDTVYPEDMNRIEGQVGKNTSEIEGVSGKIGNPSDGEEQPTLFGKIAGIGDTLSENLTPVTEKITEVLNKVTESDNKIGEESDADTQPTLFGRLAQLKNVLLEKLAELLTKVTGIDGKIGTNDDTAGTATLFGQVKDISEKMPTGAVKSIQRGEVTYRQGDDEIKISISDVNPDKCFVILNVTGNINSSDNGRFLNGAILRKITATELTVYTRAMNITNLTMWISWQVIELM